MGSAVGTARDDCPAGKSILAPARLHFVDNDVGRVTMGPPGVLGGFNGIAPPMPGGEALIRGPPGFPLIGTGTLLPLESTVTLASMRKFKIVYWMQ